MRILKQAEQWPLRVGAARKIYRGLMLQFPDARSHQRMADLLRTNPEQAQEEILGMISQNGLGRHWTPYRRVADQYSWSAPYDWHGGPGFLGQDRYKNALGVHLTGEWNGEGEDPGRVDVGGNPKEHEIPLLPGMSVRLKHMRVTVPPLGARVKHYELPFSSRRMVVT